MQKVVFIHLPKTAGTSIHKLLVENYSKENVCPERYNGLDKYSEEELNSYQLFSGHFDYAATQRIPEPKQLFTFLRKPKERILSLYYFWKSHRWDAIGRNSLGGPKIAKALNLLSFLQWSRDGIPGNIDNAMCRNLLGKFYYGEKDAAYICPKDEVVDRVIHNLSEFTYIGLTENTDQCMEKLFSILNFPIPEKVPHANNSKNISEDDPNQEPIEREEITPEIEEELERLTFYDSQVYEWAKNRVFDTSTTE